MKRRIKRIGTMAGLVAFVIVSLSWGGPGLIRNRAAFAVGTDGIVAAPSSGSRPGASVCQMVRVMQEYRQEACEASSMCHTNCGGRSTSFCLPAELLVEELPADIKNHCQLR
jgi:hypothetical protein